MSPLTRIAASIVGAFILAGSAQASPTLTPPNVRTATPRPVVREAIVARPRGDVRGLLANAAYIGKVSTIAGFTGLAYQATFDSDDGYFYLYDGGNVNRLLANGQTTQIAALPDYVTSIVWDHASQLFYLALPREYEVVSVDLQGVVNVLAGGTYGQADGKGSLAQFQYPSGIALDPVNDVLYVADNDRMRRVGVDGTVVTVGGAGMLNGGFNPSIYNLAYDTKSAEVGITNYQPDVIGAYSTVTGIYRALAGYCYQPLFGPQGCTPLQLDGRGANAEFAAPQAITYNPKSDEYYVADETNFQIRRISPDGVVATIAGSGRAGVIDGVGDHAEFGTPSCAALDPRNNKVLVCDAQGQTLRLVTSIGQFPRPIPHSFSMKMTPTLAAGPTGLVSTSVGSLWFAESAANYLARQSSAGRITEYALPGGYGDPYDVVLGLHGDIWFADYSLSRGIGTRAYIAHRQSNGRIVEFPFPNHCNNGGPSSPSSLTPAPNGNVWFAESCPNSFGFMTPNGQFALIQSQPVGGIVIGLGGYVWAGTAKDVLQYTTDGTFVRDFSSVLADAGVAIGADGNLWLLDNGNGASVEVLNVTTGGFMIYILPDCGCQRHVGNFKAAANGDLWFTQGDGQNFGYPGTISQMTETGVYTEYPIFEPRSAPSGLAFDSSGKLWITDLGAQKIGHMR